MAVRLVATNKKIDELTRERGLAKRAVDWRDSAAFTSIFLASGLYCSQAESRPTHLRLTQTVGQLPEGKCGKDQEE
jgi:hypothetical protein